MHKFNGFVITRQQAEELATQVARGAISLRQALRRVSRELEHLFKALVAASLRQNAEPPSYAVLRWTEHRLCQRSPRWMVLATENWDGTIQTKHVPLLCRSTWCPTCAHLRRSRALALIARALRSGKWVMLTLTYPESDPTDLPTERAWRDLFYALDGEPDEETARVRARMLWITSAWRQFIAELQDQWARLARRRKRPDLADRFAYIALLEIRPRLSGALKGEWVPHIHVLIRTEFLDIRQVRKIWPGGQVAHITPIGRNGRSPEKVAAYLAACTAEGKLRFGSEIPEPDRARLAAATRGLRLLITSRNIGALWPRKPGGPPAVLLRITRKPPWEHLLSLDGTCIVFSGTKWVSPLESPRGPPQVGDRDDLEGSPGVDPLIEYATKSLGAEVDTSSTNFG